VSEPASRSARILDAGGPFTDKLAGFAPRSAQIQMAQAVETALAHKSELVVEAGTGIGKTLAYLVPALLGEGRVIISTGTKNLQDQLFFRDLPLVKDALELKVKTRLLKGRSNYLCTHRMMLARVEGVLPSREAFSELEAVFDWSARTTDGDLSITPVVSEESGLMPLVTSNNDNCLGSDCPQYDECFVVRARREAQDADIVVVNHHLLFADMAVKQSGFGEILPGAAAFIVDEAHQAPETASRFFSTTLSARQIRELCRDFMVESAEVSGALAVLREPIGDCLQKLKEIELAVAEGMSERGSWEEMIRNDVLRSALQALDLAVNSLGAASRGLKDSARGLDACIDRIGEVQKRLDRFDSEPESGEVRWFERRGRGFALHITPLEVSAPFNAFRTSMDAAWLFTSATLAVKESFDHFTALMGLGEAQTLRLDSPFDYPNNALMWLPENLPEPGNAAFVSELMELVIPLLHASEGRAFLLFTSHRALRQAADILVGQVSFPLFVQGEQPRSMLLEQFRTSGDGVLLGAASFWEGVDVVGEALSLVVIDKLPFAAPDDPVMEARSELTRREGGNPFTALYLPQAVISLKQGAGRLIRDVNDRGVLVICDPRIRTRSYGRIFRDSLPPMRQADSQSEVELFLNETSTGH
jgi:ATP-dependent DNA helicase DinG